MADNLDVEIKDLQVWARKIRLLRRPHSDIFRARCRGRGMSYREVGETLGYAEETVKEYMGRIYDELGLGKETPQSLRLLLLGKIYAVMLHEDADPDSARDQPR